MSSAYIGIDVSQHNGVIDWTKVKAAGVDFAILRAGYGQNHIDTRFAFNIKGCNQVGLPCGVYWFSYATTEAAARREAQYCLAAVKPYRLDYPIAFDFEYDSVGYAAKQGVTVTMDLATRIAKAFCDTIEAAGYTVVNYANPDYLSRYFSAEFTQRYGLWLAAWNTKAEPPRSCLIWQHSCTGKVNGITGNVDMNRGYLAPAQNPRAEDGFVDVPKDAWYAEAVQWAVENGITNGTDTIHFTPNGPLTRAELVTMLKRYHDRFGG